MNIDFAYLIMKNRLPNENKSANFLAFSISTGIYSVDNDMQKMPRLTHTKKPNILCSRD